MFPYQNPAFQLNISMPQTRAFLRQKTITSICKIGISNFLLTYFQLASANGKFNK